ncbi:unnamed protein product [Meganyctiphanes norvegica]|uniref:Uncharacterized protein n=1 Tax=Meganyctiphanes norvegica TaxID=48144 RepID=A0AAV2RZ88_MEGNR
MGLCRPTDTDVIEGTAPGPAQLKFWKLCFDAILKLRQLPPTPQLQAEESRQADMALHCLAAAPYTAITLRETGISMLPADLMDGYKLHQRAVKKSSSYKPEPLEDQLQDVLLKLQQLKNNQNSSSIPIREQTDEEYERIQASMAANLNSLGEQQQVFQNVFKSTIAPWISADTHTELSNAGQLIYETQPKIQKINELIHCMKKSSSQTKVLMDAVHPSLGSSHTSAISSTIHNLVAEHSTPSFSQ